MFDKAKPARDKFTLSLGGVAAINNYAFVPAIARDRINKALDEKMRQAEEHRPESAGHRRTPWGRHWLLRRRRV